MGGLGLGPFLLCLHKSYCQGRQARRFLVILHRYTIVPPEEQLHYYTRYVSTVPWKGRLGKQLENAEGSLPSPSPTRRGMQVHACTLGVGGRRKVGSEGQCMVRLEERSGVAFVHDLCRPRAGKWGISEHQLTGFLISRPICVRCLLLGDGCGLSEGRKSRTRTRRNRTRTKEGLYASGMRGGGGETGRRAMRRGKAA
ncbi:hypothetical protein LZ32DRAFT_425527 [Colletotrichum eremochloae]|nr:hypothetical protein LZ32DRAFT_425527 [Colletotrichum eremochloae]